MKKGIAILLMTTMIFSLAACGSNAQEKSKEENEEGTKETKKENDLGKRTNPYTIDKEGILKTEHFDTHDPDSRDINELTIGIKINSIETGDMVEDQVRNETSFFLFDDDGSIPRNSEFVRLKMTLTFIDGLNDDEKYNPLLLNFDIYTESGAPYRPDGEEKIFTESSNTGAFPVAGVYKGATLAGDYCFLVPTNEKYLLEVSDAGNEIYFDLGLD